MAGGRRVGLPGRGGIVVLYRGDHDGGAGREHRRKSGVLVGDIVAVTCLGVARDGGQPGEYRVFMFLRALDHAKRIAAAR